MNNYDESPDSDTRAELLAARSRNRRLRNALMAHPDPRDPDYPGDETDEGEDE